MDISQSRRITEGVIWKQILLFFSEYLRNILKARIPLLLPHILTI